MSTEPSKVFERRFQNRLADLNHATEEAVRFIEENGVNGAAVHVANLAIEEMATNILKYGYDDANAHEILLGVEILPERLLLILEDDGHEFNPLKVPDSVVDLPAEMRVPGGLGIHLVRRFAEEMRYERRDCRNRLTIAIRR
ncbi:MAG: ATP-binding protein [Verrucomicrobia bacterium]|nr:ATP-binding protein [Verrucomicrobiota bacterium]